MNFPWNFRAIPSSYLCSIRFGSRYRSMFRGESRGGEEQRCASNHLPCAFRGTRGCLSGEARQSRRVTKPVSIRGRTRRGDAGSCTNFHASQVNLFRSLDSLRLSPRLNVKLDCFAKVFLGGGEGSPLCRYRHVQATRDKPFTIILKYCMDHSHTPTLCTRIGRLASGVREQEGAPKCHCITPPSPCGLRV
jgi:hypothetical protein